MFIIKSEDVKNNVHIHKGSYWLSSKDYEKYRDNWDIIGSGYKI